MQPIYRQTFTVDALATDCFGRLKSSMLLYYIFLLRDVREAIPYYIFVKLIMLTFFGTSAILSLCKFQIY